MFKNVNEAITYIESRRKNNRRKDLSRINYIFNKLGRIDKNFKILHIAGTNGKGSTCFYLSNYLIKKGYRVGLFTSPYILKFNERIIINNEMISDLNLLKYANKAYLIIKEYENIFNDIVPFFEFTLIIAFLYFNDLKIDYLVLECGLGGLLDATNFVDSICSIITNISYDHLDVLGPTINDIAKHKAGIIKQKQLVFTYNNPLVIDIIKNECEKKDSKLFLLEKDDIKIIDNMNFIFNNIIFNHQNRGSFQAYNIVLAYEVLKELFKDDFDLNTFFLTIKTTTLSCRYEFIDRYIIDGAHNIAAARVLVESLINDKIDKIDICLAILNNKDYKAIIEELKKIAKKFYIVKFKDNRALDNKELISYIENYEIIDINDIVNIKSDKLLITGSLHFAASARKLILNESHS